MAANLSGAAVDRDDVADRGAAVADARVERAEGELEAAAVALLDAGDERVEAPALAVDLDDVALRDALRGEPLRGGRRGAGRAGRRRGCSIAPATLARRPDGGGDRVPHAPVQRHVRRAVGADVEQRGGGAPAGERLLERRAQAGERLGRGVLEAEQRRGALEVEAGRRGDVLLEGVG